MVEEDRDDLAVPAPTRNGESAPAATAPSGFRIHTRAALKQGTNDTDMAFLRCYTKTSDAHCGAAGANAIHCRRSGCSETPEASSRTEQAAAACTEPTSRRQPCRLCHAKGRRRC